MKRIGSLSLSALTFLTLAQALTSCGGESNRVEESPGIVTGSTTPIVTQKIIPQVGQQVISQRLGKFKLNQIDQCQYSQRKLTQTVVKAEGDDIFIFEDLSLTDKTEQSDESCSDIVSKRSRLIKKSLRGELAELELTKKAPMPGCQRDCDSSILSLDKTVIINTKGIYYKNGKEIQRIASYSLNTQTPWLSKYNAYTINDKNMATNKERKITESFQFLNNFNISKLSFDLTQFKTKSYGVKALNVTKSVANILAGQTFIQGTDFRFPISFFQEQDKLLMIREGDFNNDGCNEREISTIDEIISNAPEGQEAGLDQDVLTLRISQVEHKIMGNSDPSAKSISDCSEDFEVNGTDFLKIYDNGNLEMNIEDGEFEGDIFRPI